MSALSSILANPGADRAALREKLEQGVFGVSFAAFGLCLIVAMSWLGMIQNRGAYPSDYLYLVMPTSSGGSLFSAKETAVIALTRRGEIVSEGIWIRDADFDAVARKALAASPGRSVTLQADGQLPFSVVASMVRRLKALGARRVHLQTYGSTDPLLKLFSAPWSTNLERD